MEQLSVQDIFHPDDSRFEFYISTAVCGQSIDLRKLFPGTAPQLTVALIVPTIKSICVYVLFLAEKLRTITRNSGKRERRLILKRKKNTRRLEHCVYV